LQKTTSHDLQPGLNNKSSAAPHSQHPGFNNKSGATSHNQHTGFDTRLSAHEKDKQRIINKEEVKIPEIENILSTSYSLHPDYYLGSNKNRKKKKWIFYNTFTFVDADKRIHLFQGSRNFNKLFLIVDRLSQIFRGIRLFDVHVDQEKTMKLLHMSMLVSFSPSYIRKAKEFKKNLKGKDSRLFYKKLYIQEGPEITGAGDIEHCKSCPDATIRDGKLVPVCLVDVLAGSEFQL
jgi:hypothetical protein